MKSFKKKLKKLKEKKQIKRMNRQIVLRQKIKMMNNITDFNIKKKIFRDE